MKLAVVREEACVGCAKCIPACPVDAIIGASKQLHIVLTDECIGCGLCLPPCPMDCIDIVESIQNNSEEKKQRAAKAKLRYQNRLQRLSKETPKMLPTFDSDLKIKIQGEITNAFMRTEKKRKK